jgi:hypothetical protein
MRRMAWWGTTTGLAVSLVWGGAAGAEEKRPAPARPAAEGRPEATDAGWAWWPFGGDRSPRTAQEAEARARSTEGRKPPKPVASPLTDAEPITDVVSVLETERAQYLRRQAVCIRLKEIALETGDTQLDQQADLLEQRALYVYQQRTAKAKLALDLPPRADAAAALTGEGPAPAARAAQDRPTRRVPAGSPGGTGREEDGR